MAGDRAEEAGDLAPKTVLALPFHDGLDIDEGGGVRLDYFEDYLPDLAAEAQMVRLTVRSYDEHLQTLEGEEVFIDSAIMDEIARAWLQWRINVMDEARNRTELLEQTVSASVEQDIDEARQIFAELLAIEGRMAAAAVHMRDPLRWLEASSTLWKARALLQRFIGERLTSDIVRAHHGDL